MIKTHKPRCHIWTNASAFQQTKEYRNVKFEECTTLPSQVLVPDSDKDLSKGERAAKRRRIEKLADDFLNGVPLFISSARPCPQSLEETVVRYKKTSGEPKFQVPALEPSADSDEACTVWEEQETDLEVLERLRRPGHQTVRENSNFVDSHDETWCGALYGVPQVVEAQASCAPVRRQNPSVLHARPSNEALKQAAALRARRLQRANSDIAVVQDSITPTVPTVHADAELRSEPAHEATRIHRTSFCLSRRKSRFSFNDEGDHDFSIDKLRLPGNEFSSVHIKGRGTGLEPAPVNDDERTKAQEVVAQQRLRKLDLCRQDVQSDTASYQTALDETEVDSEPVATPDPTPHHCGTFLNINQMPVLHRSTSDVEQAHQGPRPKSSGHNTPQQSLTTRLTRSTTSRQANSEGITMPITGDSHMPAFRLKPNHASYATAQGSQNGSTPLIFRKGRLRSHKTSSEEDLIDAREDRNEPGLRRDSMQELEPISSEQLETKNSLPEKWAGTQVLLAQAQKDLIVSPERQNANESSADQDSSHTPVDTPQEKLVGREQLKQFSQEPLPSTQQLLGDFTGWSTVKKPRGGYPDSPGPTPTALGKAAWTSVNAKRVDMSTAASNISKDLTDRRRSSLRFSITVATPPGDAASGTERALEEHSTSEPSVENIPTPTPSSRSSKEQRSSPQQSLNNTIRPSSAQPTEDNLTSESFASARSLSSFQLRQRQTGLLNDLSDLHETIEDLTKDLLNLEDVDAVLSQVG